MKLKSALSDTPEIQDIRRVIRVLRDDSERKLKTDAEVYDAISKLNNQVHRISDSLVSISDAFTNERANQAARICEIEERLRCISERQVCTAEAMESQLMNARQEMEAMLAKGICETTAHATEVGNAHKEALTRFQEDMYAELGGLSNATMAKMAEMTEDTKRLLGCVIMCLHHLSCGRNASSQPGSVCAVTSGLMLQMR